MIGEAVSREMVDFALQDELIGRRKLVEKLIADLSWTEAAHGAAELADEVRSDAGLQMQASACLSKIGKFEDALPYALRAVELAPAQPEYFLHFGIVLNACGRHESAARVLARAVDLDSSLAEAYQQSAFASAQQGNAAVAANLAMIAWELEPENDGRKLAAAHYLTKAARVAEAIEILRDERSSLTHKPVVLRTLSGLLALDERLDDALLEIDAAIEMQPATAEFHLHRSGLLIQLGRTQEALDAVRRAIELDPGDRVVRRHAITVFAEGGEIEEALRHGGALLAAAPHEQEYLSCVAYLIDAQAMHNVAREFDDIAALKLAAPPRVLPPPPSFADKWLTQRRSIFALVLRDIRSRYGESRLGFFWALMEPFIHVGFLALVFEFTMHGHPPLGENFFFFYFTGVMPYLMFSHLVTDIGHSVRGGRQLLQIARVTPFDLVFAKAIVDVFMSTIIYLVFSALFAIAGVDATPVSIPMIAIAFGLASLMGVGAGMLCAALFEFGPFAESVVNIILRVMYFASGIFYVPGAMPLVARNILVYNPFLHVIDAMRMAYFANYSPPWSDLGYSTVYSVTALAVGMVAVAVMSRRMRSIT